MDREDSKDPSQTSNEALGLLFDNSLLPVQYKLQEQYKTLLVPLWLAYFQVVFDFLRAKSSSESISSEVQFPQ